MRSQNSSQKRNSYERDDFEKGILDEDQEFDSKLEAKNIIRAFIQTENDAQEIKAKNLRTKPSLWKQQEKPERQSYQQEKPSKLMSQLSQMRDPNANSELDNDISLALEIIQKRKEIGKQATASEGEKDVMMGMEMRQAKIKQMKEQRLQQVAEQKIKMMEDRIRNNQKIEKLKKNRDTWDDEQEQKKQNTSIISANSNMRGSSYNQRNSNNNSFRGINTSVISERKENTQQQLDQKQPIKVDVKSEIMSLKNKREVLEKQSKKMEEDMKNLKENLKKDIFKEQSSSKKQDKEDKNYQYEQSDISNNDSGVSAINQTIQLLQKEADESRMKYNEFRLSKLVKAINFASKRYRRVYFNIFFESIKSQHREIIKSQKQNINLMRLKQTRIIFSAWKKYLIDKKDARDIQFYLQEKIYEDTFMNKAAEYYQKRIIRMCMKQWKKYYKIEKQEKKLKEESLGMKDKINNLFNGLQSSIQKSEMQAKQLKDMKKEMIIKEYLEKEAQQSQKYQEEENISKQSANISFDEKKQSNSKQTFSSNSSQIQKAPQSNHNKNQSSQIIKREQNVSEVSINKQQQFIQFSKDNSFEEQQNEELARSKIPLPIQASFQQNQDFNPNLRQKGQLSDQAQSENQQGGQQQNEQFSFEDQDEQFQGYEQQQQQNNEGEEGDDEEQKYQEQNQYNSEEEEEINQIQNEGDISSNKGNISKIDSQAQAIKREEKLKEIQQRNEERKRKAEEFKKKHEDIRKQKELEKIKREEEQLENERIKRQAEYQAYQNKKKEEKDKKEQIEREKMLLVDQMQMAKQHKNKQTLKYYGLNPWKKLIELEDQKMIKASEFSYNRILKFGFVYLSSATRISKKLFQEEMNFKASKADKHYKKQILRKGMEMIKDYVEKSLQEGKELQKNRILFLKRIVFSKWNSLIDILKEENQQFEDQYIPIISQFRKVVLLLRSFKGWRIVSEEERKERLKQGHKEYMWGKVNNWLSEFKENENNRNINQLDQQQDIASSIVQIGDSEYEEINKSEIGRQALNKYFQKKQKQNSSGPSPIKDDFS